MTEAIMAAVHNYFETGMAEGDFPVREGSLVLPFPLPFGAFLLLRGTGTEDGLYPCLRLGGPDRTVSGRVWVLEPPADFRRLCRDIADFCEQYPPDPYRKERLGEYSCEKGGDWRTAFAARLLPYTRMASEVY